MTTGAYFELWNLISDFVYGADAVLTSDQQLTLTIICTLGALFIVALPFVLVWRILRMFA